jgi:hypothetical protein
MQRVKAADRRGARRLAADHRAVEMEKGGVHWAVTRRGLKKGIAGAQ